MGRGAEYGTAAENPGREGRRANFGRTGNETEKGKETAFCCRYSAAALLTVAEEGARGVAACPGGGGDPRGGAGHG